MNEADKKIKTYIERAVPILGIEITKVLTPQEVIDLAKLQVEVAKMIQLEELKLSTN